MYRVSVFSFLFLLLFQQLNFAGTTGKISGRVTDKETGEPLIGVNIIVKDTRLGATTDLDGYYTILSVPPGSQTVVASMVGYSPSTINDVIVHIDQTSPLNIQLSTEAIEMGSVTVVGERTLVKKDVSSSIAQVTPAEIETLPVKSIDEVVSLQAGVEQGLVIRGAEADQVLFQLDGVTLRDPRNNLPISSVALTSIQEVSLERGGFNAEYGQVRSGLLNIVTREGDVNSYYGSVQVKYSPPSPKHFGISVFDPNSMWNRPFLDPEVAWAGTANGGWDEYTARQYPNFEGWNSVSKRSLEDDDPSNDISPAAAQRLWQWQHRRMPNTKAPDYNIDASLGGPIPFISQSLGDLRFFASYRLEREMLLIPLSRDDYRENFWSVKLNSDINNEMKLSLTGSGGTSYNVAINADDRAYYDPAWGVNGVQFWNPTDYVRTPISIAEITNEQRAGRIYTDSWYSQAVISHTSFAAKLQGFFTQNTFYEISFENVNRNYDTNPIRDRDTTKKYSVIPGRLEDEAPYGYSADPATGIGDPAFFFGGHSSTARDSSKVSSFLLRADLTSQVNKENMVKFGVEFATFNLNLNYALINEAFGGSNIVKSQFFPYRVSAYLQDKIEMFGFIANLGLRLDVSNPNTEWADVDMFDPDYFSSKYANLADYPKKKAEVDYALSPRLGISHPITDVSKLYFNYGHFKQMPAYEETFRMGRAPSGNMLNFGNPNLQLAKTISYELGYDHEIFEEYLVQIAAFYNDISDQQAYTQIISEQKNIGYFAANNNSYEDIRGLELTLRKTQGMWLRGFATFTYQVNTQGSFGRQTINEDPKEQKIIDQNTINLYQQKPVPQPRANLSLTFFTPVDYGPDWGIFPLGNISLNVLGSWKAGEYFTYNPKQVRDIINNVQVTDFFNIDLRFAKGFQFSPLDLTLYVEVRNLFNNKRMSGAGFYDTYDQQYYFESLHLPSSRAYDNIPGDDRIGDYRKTGVDFQPIEQLGNVNSMDPATAKAKVIYYDRSSGRYMNAVNGQWAEVENSRMQKVLDDKAYIDMPNNSSFNFLNPRQIYFGINIAFKY